MYITPPPPDWLPLAPPVQAPVSCVQTLHSQPTPQVICHQYTMQDIMQGATCLIQLFMLSRQLVRS